MISFDVFTAISISLVLYLLTGSMFAALYRAGLGSREFLQWSIALIIISIGIGTLLLRGPGQAAWSLPLGNLLILTGTLWSVAALRRLLGLPMSRTAIAATALGIAAFIGYIAFVSTAQHVRTIGTTSFVALCAAFVCWPIVLDKVPHSRALSRRAVLAGYASTATVLGALALVAALTRWGPESLGLPPAEKQVVWGFMLAPFTMVWSSLGCLAVVLDDMHRQSRAFLDRAQAIVRTNPLASILTDAESHKVIDVNDAFLRMFGLATQQVVDRATDELGLFDTERLIAYRQLLRTNGAVEDLIVTRDTDEGENRTLKVSGHRLSLDGKDFYLTFIRDISNEVRAANLLRREKEGAQNEARVKSHFLAMMSHEFRTPLTAAAGLAALLKEDEHDREKRRRLDGIIAATSALTHLVEDVLDLSRLENNELVTLCRTFDPGSVVERVEAICSAAAARKGLAFTIEIDPRLPHRIVGDQNRIAQVAINLMHNAIKFTDTGSVTLFIGRASSRGEVAERLVVEVRDTGPGIDPNDRERLFQPFNQGRTARPPEGAGLGLAICRHLAALMDGSVTVRPNPQGGSVFRVDLPLVVGAPDLPDGRARIAASDTDRHWAGLKVLVAEDAALNREVLTQQLVSAGAEVVSVADGASACILVATAEPRFDVVLLDMSMPGLSGPEACERLRLTWRGQTQPIVALTASSEEVDRRACEAAGMDLFVSKPYDLADVGRQIGAILAASNHCEPTSSIGFDHVAAARSWADDATPLATLLVGFADTNEDIGGKLTALYRENRIDELRTSVHRLRGLAALLQANRLKEAAARIEAMVAANDSASDLTEDLARLEQSVLAHVDLVNSARDESRFAQEGPQPVHA